MKTMIVVLLLACVPFCAGCGAHEFMLRAPQGIAQAANNVEVGVEEGHADSLVILDDWAAKQRNALADDVAEYVVKVVDAGVKPGTVTTEMAKEKLATVFAKNDQAVADILAKRKVEESRYLLMKEALQWIRETCAQVGEIETRRYATIEELKALAVSNVRKALATPPAAQARSP